MSAFVCSNDHIDALLTFAINSSVSYWNGTDRTAITRHNATEVGAILIDENLRSVGERYRGDLGGEDNAAAEYVFRTFGHVPDAVAVLKGCSCYDYQACETDDYNKSVAYTIVDAIRAAAIRRLPGYENAEGWEFRRPQAQPVYSKPVGPARPAPLTPGQKAAATRRARAAARAAGAPAPVVSDSSTTKMEF